MGLLSEGIFGMGGYGGMGGAKPPAGLLGKHFDPAEMRKQQLKQGLLMAGIGMLTNGKGSTGEVLGQSLGAGLQGANQAGLNYKNEAMGYQQMEAQMAEEQRKNQEYQEKEKQKAAIMQMIAEDTPENQQLALTNPQAYAELRMKQQFAGPAEGFTLGEGQQRFDATGKPIASGAPKPPESPKMETLYDEKTGQPYKAQWDASKNEWVRVGGNKSDDALVEITNPDGTVTRVGGSGAKTTEADRRAILLAQQIVAQEPALMQSFDALATGQNTIGGATGVAGRGFMTGEGQNASDALTNVVANWLYLTSGATATDQEVKRQVGMVLPTVLDKPENIAAKKARLQSIIDTMKMRANIQPQAAPNANAPKVRVYNPETGKLE
jgi:hypothetical protein